MEIARPRELADSASISAAAARIPTQTPPVFSPSVSSYAHNIFYARRPSTASSAAMPRPNPPPTPGSSSDLRGKEGANAPPTFNLPPTAYQDADRASTGSATPSANGSDSSYRPVSPASPAESSRKRPAPQSGPVITKDDFALPPPPTRSRKIIQMKPRESEREDLQQTPTALAGGPVAAKTPSTAQPAGKRKQNNASSTAAGRKIARKTAHSLIERRRRSKMNEEFGVLKDMIPACKGQEMHKLAILQASIEYLRYLEQCVSDLQAQNNSPKPLAPMLPQQRAQEERDDDDDEDEEMEDDADQPDNENETAVSTPATAPQDRSGSVVSLPSLSQITTTTTTSPSVYPGRHYSISSAASQASYSPYFHSNQTSPAFGPQLPHGPPTTLPAPSYSTSLGSPALQPLEAREEGPEKQRKVGRSEQDLTDQEGTAAALLMLNHDRRSWQGGRGGRERGTGMSVKDLLSG